jgi:hypothetical protein
MRVLKPNDGKCVKYIVSNHSYVKVWDYGKKHILCNIKMSDSSFGEKIWAWILTSAEDGCTDLKDVAYSSFDEAINRAVNNPYCTVYTAETFLELADNWEKIKYIDTIETSYVEKSDKNV